ncbi:conserved hypothetical protein [Alkaliphilus metalliredigens QYMF]|uniref:DUF2213 domain-containing protein n=1 Tax=Alkaliphilus metalliredigens (strain QYMF) TaxID=293826 RepID=A6TKC8_ALKMQ|nr:DUF2213 domain-containing protein [Alkaliphilus metalliredigens]ABR46646.1 conserved hypothetical protein [Alkaliphilus metalliredigens QYMF]ABR48118.1 conserved hypothetical protein [Alkaliphilus metalliredigens QYMF]ABR50437.1 conserved hypothetical protein [Alkaliphilus metalliredigens QYMF]
MLKQRYDRVEVNMMQEDGRGFLNYSLAAVKPGVYPYMDYESGQVIYELKHPDDLIKVVEQLNNLPITDGHPYELISAHNSKELVAGWTHEKAEMQDVTMVNKATVFDAKLIADIVTGLKKECSLGFECRVIDESGVYEGQKYDRRQTDFKFNHLAMVKKGRCGPECSARTDEKESFAVQIRTDEIENYKEKEGMKEMKIRLDGVEYEVPEVVATRVTALETKSDELTKQVGQLEGKLDGKEDEIKKLQEKKDELEKNQLSEIKLDQAIEARLKVVQDAAIILDPDYDFKGKKPREIKVDCIKVLGDESFTGEGKSEEYIDARFDTIVDFYKNTEHSSTGANNLKIKNDAGAGDLVTSMKSKRLQMKK